MSKLSQTLGEKYQQNSIGIFTRTFELGGHQFKVRVPKVAETDAIYEKVMKPDPDAVEKIYKTITEPLLQFKDSVEKSDNVVFLDNDIVVEGRSMREAAKTKAMTEAKITEYIKLLVPENQDASMADITYADIEEEFPLSIQLVLVEKIGEVISPSYKENQKN